VTGAVSLLSTSKLTFQLGGLTQGNQYGFLNANGTVALNGDLVVSFVNSFQADSKDNFTVLSATALSGAFTNVASGTRLATTDGSGTFLVTYNGTTIVLSDFESGTPAAPSSKTVKSTDAVVGPRSAPKSKVQKNSEGETWNEVPKAPGAAVNANQDPDQSAVPSANEPKVSPSIRLANRRTATAKGRGRSIAINLKNTDQLLDLLEGPSAKVVNGKVTVKARTSANRGHPGSGQIQPNGSSKPSDNSNVNRRDPSKGRTGTTNRIATGRTVN
jgi:hypothetical protein